MDPPAEQHSSSSESEDVLNSSMEHEETSTADERESRRLRRELLNTDASILYESDDQEDRQGPVTRARRLDQESMEISSEQQDGVQGQSEQPPALNPPRRRRRHRLCTTILLAQCRSKRPGLERKRFPSRNLSIVI
jgi:hypothetical protein